jgi:hypothetical protein
LKPLEAMSLPMRQHLKLLASLQGASTENSKVRLVLNNFVLKALEGRKLAKKVGAGYRITLLGLVEYRKLEQGIKA